MDVDDQRQSSSSEEDDEPSEAVDDGQYEQFVSKAERKVNGDDGDYEEADSSASEEEEENSGEEGNHGQDNGDEESSEDEDDQDEGVESKKNSSEVEENEGVSSMSEAESDKNESSAPPKKIVIKFDKHVVVANGSAHQEEAVSSDSDDEAVRKSRRSKDKPRKKYNVSDQEDDDDGFEDEESPKAKGRGRPKKSSKLNSTTSPEDSGKKKRGRPKKVVSENGEKKLMKDEDISAALEESYQEKPKRNRKSVKYDSGDNAEESESEKEESASDSEDPDSDEQPQKKRKMELADEEVGRRSGRERKVPKKFEVIIPEKKKRKKKIITSDFSENEDSESDYGSKKRKRKKTKKLDKFNIYKKSPTKVKRKKKEKADESDDSDASDLSEGEAEYAKRYKTLTKKMTKNGGQISAADYGEKKSIRVRKTVSKYVEEAESHSSDVASDFDPNAVVVEEEEMEGIHVILDYRKGKVGATGESTMIWTVKEHGDPNLTLETEDTEDQFWIKWKGWSHLNNTWESQASLDAKKKGDREVQGIRKLINYQVKVADYNMWKRRANPEDVEYQEIDIEMGRQLLQSYTEVDRVFSHRKNENNANDYYCKWKNLSYGDSTWEDETVVKNYYKEELDLYNARKKAKTNPRNYKDSMKYCKKSFKSMKEQPEYIGSETLRLRDYQLDGINFLLKAWHNGNSTILADEMGLGKTIQSITFLKYLFHNYPFKGPILVCVPLSTMAAWQKEFLTWAPDMNMVCYVGDSKSREIIRTNECENADGELTFNVLLTNYEMVCKDKTFFQDIVWSNIVVDEAHRLKNKESLLYQVLIGIESHHRLLLTGTPLQNSLKELWCLLNYLQLPDIQIDSWDDFEANYGTEEDKASGYVKLHTLLKPYIIRRMKKDVEKSMPPKVEQILRVEMTIRQKKIYRLVLTRNYDALARGKNQVSLINIMMQLRKTCNHAELVGEPDEQQVQLNPADRLKQLIYGSGKLLLLDKLLTRFKENGDRVLIFSQFVIMLNILEEYMQLKRYPFQILTGGVSGDKRKQSIAQFNDPNSRDFCFLLSTKAGGLGINLQTANRVIIFDSDWNPQNDLQAIARAHRIGQKQEVKIFRLVASCSVDEDIIHRAKNKMVLDHLVIQSMDTTGKSVITGKESKKGSGNTPFDKAELNMILKFGAEDLFKTEESEEQDKEVDLDAILQSAETREDEEAPQSEANKELLGAFKCTNIAFDEEEEEEEEPEADVGPKDWSDIIPSAMLEQQKPKTGIEMYSDPEELFNPIAMRRKKRSKIKKRAEEDDSAPNSVPQSRDGSDFDGEDVLNQEDSADSDMTDGEREMMKTLKKKQYKESVEKRGTYAKKTVICLKCKKCFVDKKGLRKHMKEVHKMDSFIFTPDNALEVQPDSNDTPVENGGEIPVKKRRGPPAGNTRCFPCGKSFQHRLGYKSHIKKKHEGVEPQENLDPKNLAMPDDRISCLICHKKFTTTLGLKGHIQKIHMGLAKVESNNLNEEDKPEEEDEDDVSDEEDKKESTLAKPKDKSDTTVDVKPEGEDPLILNSGNPETENVSIEEASAVKSETKDVKSSDESKPVEKSVCAEDARLIEKMYYMMRKYGCSLCSVRFNTKDKLTMHEIIHANDKKPVMCPYCDKSYSRRDKLRKHVEKIHPGLAMPDPVSPPPKKAGLPKIVKPPKQKLPKEKLPKETPGEKVNVITVTINGQTKFKCPECDTMFSYQKGCVRHMKMFHNGEKGDFSCPLCPLSYKDNKGLYQHMHRKHRDQKGAIPPPEAQETPDNSDSDSSEAVSEAVSETVAETVGATYACKFCPKVYGNAGSLWQHKKSKHADVPKGASPLVKTPSLKITAVKAPNKKEYICQVCTKTYSNYMSLYMHKKTKHPGIPPGSGEGSAPSTPTKNGNVQVLVLGAGGLTPTGRREKIHQCAKCAKKYADLKGLAAHIEKSHSQLEITPVKQTPEKEKVNAECPYCTSTYSRRDKLYEHIRRIHPGQEVPTIERSPKAKTPTVEDGIDDNDENSSSSNMSNNPGGGFGAGMIRIMPANKGKASQGQRGKYKQKEYICPHCKKGYADATRLKEHVEKAHERTNDPWRDVGPNTDIAVRNSMCKTGFEVFKVLGVYSTGLRFRAARFAPVDHDKWKLTEEINKNVMKQNIIKILTSMKKEGGLFKIDSEELVSLLQIVSVDVDASTPRESRNARDINDASVEPVELDEPEIPQYEEEELEESEVPQYEEDQYEEEQYEDDLQNGHGNYEFEDQQENENAVMVEPVFENGEVMVQPVFEEGYSEMDVEMIAE